MTTTMKESAARHMAAGVEDLDELARLVEQDTGRTPGSATLADYRSRFRRSGEDWIEVERARVNSLTNRWRAENYARKLLGACRGSAKQRGHVCTITEADIEALLAPMTCSVTGLPLSLEHEGDTRRNPWAPSIDRLDCSEGYVPGNVRVVCAIYNLARGDFPDEVVVTMAKALAARAP